VGVVKEVEKLAASGTDPAVMKSFIESWPTPYRVTADDILRLHNEKIPSDVLTTLIQHGAELGTQAAASAMAQQPGVMGVPPAMSPTPGPEVTYPAPDYSVMPNYLDPNYGYGYPDYSYAYPYSYPYYSYYPYYPYYGYGWPFYSYSFAYWPFFYGRFHGGFHHGFDHRFDHGFANRGFGRAGFGHPGGFVGHPGVAHSFAQHPAFVAHSGGFSGRSFGGGFGGRSFGGGSFGHGGGMGGRGGGHR
jgi:acidic type I keratin